MLASSTLYCETKLYLISQNSFERALDVYKIIPKVKKYSSGVEISSEQLKKFKDELASFRSLNEKINEVILHRKRVKL